MIHSGEVVGFLGLLTVVKPSPGGGCCGPFLSCAGTGLLGRASYWVACDRASWAFPLVVVDCWGAEEIGRALLVGHSSNFGNQCGHCAGLGVNGLLDWNDQIVRHIERLGNGGGVLGHRPDKQVDLNVDPREQIPEVGLVEMDTLDRSQCGSLQAF